MRHNVIVDDVTLPSILMWHFCLAREITEQPCQDPEHLLLTNRVTISMPEYLI